ncbi:EAL domain-containing protein [Vibrio cholerae]|uniref:EAL domain-containing protein n=1 Tax=Vibrio cholerae TaxID=666 RepID=UPI001E64B6AF|nr:EAL domain-containing protein [Vibrio cholerae]MCD6656858.1 EAL domain-containing protein [Vibrio cholerae]
MAKEKTVISKAPMRIAFAILLSPLIIFLLAQPLWAPLVAQHLLNQKFAEINQYLEQRSLALDSMITQQVQSLTFTCNSHDQQLIRDPQFYNRFVRLIGIENAQGDGCSTVGYPIALAADSSASEPMGFTLSATPVTQTASRELLIQYSEPRGRVFWVVDGSWAQELLREPCSDCFYLQFKFLDPMLSELAIQRGNIAILGESNPLSIRQHSGNAPFHSEQTLLAGETLLTFARQQVFTWGLPLAVLLGVFLSASYLILRNYRNSIEGLIEKGIRDEEFIPYYQPIVDSRTQEVVGYEVLLRWQKGHQLVPPSLFISVAEDSGLVVKITNQLIQQVYRDLALIPAPRWVSINVVADHLEQHHLTHLLEELHWPYSERLKFELTERVPIKAMTQAQEEVFYLLKKGYQFKIDDFGTGYGGFAYLQNLQISSIKIDKMFVDTINTHDVKISVLDSIIASAKGGNIEVIAEGVEHQYQVDYLAERNVFWIQGYFYAKPMPLEQVLAFEKQPSIPLDFATSKT